jgi:pimeloyl-ACP methyl ester carboxylesterase
MIDNLPDLVNMFRDLLEIGRLLPGTGSRRDMVLTSSGLNGLAGQKLFVADSLLEALPDTRDNQVFKALDEELRPVSYYDNLRRSTDTLVFYLHGLGLDQDDFYHVLMETKYRSIAPTLYGFHPSESNPRSIPLDTHCYLIARFIESIAGELAPKRIVLVGFSTGADMLLRIPRFLNTDGYSVAGVLLLDCNINQQTCFISRELRRVLDGEVSALQLAHAIGSGATSITDWLDLHQYLVRVLGKFKGNLRHLALFANDVFTAQPEGGVERFAELYRELLSWSPSARWLFS